jgi:hypothetical protein
LVALNNVLIVNRKKRMTKDIIENAKVEILKFLTMNPESNLVDIENHIRAVLIKEDITRHNKMALARTATNALVKKKHILATPCKTTVIKIVPVVKKYGFRNQSSYISNTEVPTQVWFTYSVTGAKRNSLIGEHIYGI